MTKKRLPILQYYLLVDFFDAPVKNNVGAKETVAAATATKTAKVTAGGGGDGGTDRDGDGDGDGDNKSNQMTIN